MNVKVTMMNGASISGTLKGDEVAILKPQDVLPWVLNDDRKFIPIMQPNGTVMQFNKNAIAFISREI